MEEETKVLFRFSQNDLIGEAMIYSEKFESHWQPFTDKYPQKYPEDIHLIFKEKIVEAKNIVADKNLRKVMVSDTEGFDAIAAEFYDTSIDITFCASDVFSAKPAINSLFTIGKLNNSKNSRPKFSAKARDFAKLVRQYEKELKEAGCKEEDLVAIEKLVAKLDGQHWERVVSTLVRNDFAIKRKKSLNAVWLMMVHIHEGSKVVFHNNPDLLALFELPKPKRKKKGPDERKKGDSPEKAS